MIIKYLRKFIRKVFYEEIFELRYISNGSKTNLVSLTDICKKTGYSIPTLSARFIKHNIKPIKIMGSMKLYDYDFVLDYLKKNPIMRKSKKKYKSYYSVEEVAKILAIDKSNIYRYVRNGKLKFTKINNIICFEKKYINLIKGKKLWS